MKTDILAQRTKSSREGQTQLHHLQHTADILSQRVSQETSSLKDDLKALFDDRRMASREAGQMREGDISELNYKISARLGGDARGNVEALMWRLTRMEAMALGVLATSSITALSLVTRANEREREREKAKKNTAGSLESGGRASGGSMMAASSSSVGPSAVVAEETALAAEKGENVGYVSLG